MADPTPFTREHLDGVVRLFAGVGWRTYYADPERTYRALTSPGSTTLVAVDQGRVVGLVQMQSDGHIQAHLSALAVDEGWRGRGLARTLLREALRRSGAIRVDILSSAESFYARLGATPRPGFRLNREQLGLEAEA
jgi:ribosomal protein S18 acetylase RimI-like enzyme